MSVAALGSVDRGLLALDRTALGAVLLTPLFLLHAHGVAEGAIGVADACFLIRSVVTRDWAWLRTPWLMIGVALWAWLMVCSLPIPALGLGEGGRPELIQALVMVRFPVLIAAMEHAILRAAAPRRWLGWVVAASAAYIAGQAIIQFVFGRNLYGDPAQGNDGVLSGPFAKPRAGPPLARILLPAVIPAVAAMLRRPGVGSMMAGYGLLLVGVAVMVLIGQRMPLLLTLLGIVVVALLLRQLRPAMIAAAVVAGLLLAASPVVAPQVYYRLVEKFSSQLETFASTPYGELYTRALIIGADKPLTGLGMNGFRHGCPEPRYFRPSFDGKQPDGGGAEICWHHPHNYYLEALDDGGFLGLALFCARRRWRGSRQWDARCAGHLVLCWWDCSRRR